VDSRARWKQDTDTIPPGIVGAPDDPKGHLVLHLSRGPASHVEGHPRWKFSKRKHIMG
jgi:hypothetical protein